MGTTGSPDQSQWRAGMVTRVAPPLPVDPAVAPEPAPPPDPDRSRKRTMLLFGGLAGAIALIGLVIALVLVLTGQASPFRPRYEAPAADRPPLADLCPPPSVAPERPPAAGAPDPSGPRTTDPEAGISYRQYGEPWLPWQDRWSAGTLQVTYAVGQHFVTEVYPGGTYHASILSGSVPATVNDAMTIDLECTGRQVAADARASYYPQPNSMEMLRDERTVLNGLPAWVTKFRLHFTERGLTAKSELVGFALIDVGRPDAAVLYVSIPDTHRQLDWVVDDVLRSTAPA